MAEPIELNVLIDAPPARAMPVPDLTAEGLAAKLAKLKAVIGRHRSAAVAFSAGVDSTFLVRVAADVLGERLVAVTGDSETYMPEELEQARALAAEFGVTHRVIQTRELSDEHFAVNRPDRCYWCKQELFSKIKEIAIAEGIEAIFDGAIVDDLGDHRPGRKAAEELAVVSPLVEAGLCKAEIRELSRQLGLPTAEKPAMACLSSRFVYGDPITVAKLQQVAEAERVLRRLGFRQMRVRHHDTVARVEVAPQEMARALELSREISAGIKAAGYHYVALDLDGYRTGAMNEVLKAKDRQ